MDRQPVPRARRGDRAVARDGPEEVRTDQSATPVTHIQVATAANKIDAASALTAQLVKVFQDAADRAEVPSIQARARIRGNCGFVVELCRRAVQELCQASGASGIMSDVPSSGSTVTSRP